MIDKTHNHFMRFFGKDEMPEDDHAEVYPYELICDLGALQTQGTGELPEDMKSWMDAHIVHGYDFVVARLGSELSPSKVIVTLWFATEEDLFLAKLAWG
jgi:hypothetical protein